MLAGRQHVGHPVNVATGTVYSTHRDYSIPGKIDLVWERLYSTALLEAPASPLGSGWTTRYFATLTRLPGEYRFVTPEGDVEVFADPQGQVERGGLVRNLGTYQELFKAGGRYIVVRWSVESGVVERYLFQEVKGGESWPLETIESVTGHALDLHRDAAGRLTGIRQRLEKRTLTIDYTAENRIRQVSLLLPGGQRQTLARYEFDSRGCLTAAEDALRHADRYEYDAAGRMTREVVKDGGVFSFKYDEKGRCVKTWGLDRYDEKVLAYREAAGWTQVTDSLGNTTLFQWSPTGQVVQEVDPLGGIRRTEYDDQGRIVALINQEGAATRIEYDAQGNRAAVVSPLGARYEFRYNSAHFPLTLTDAAGGVWTREYDAANRISATVDPLGHCCTYAYDAAGNLASVTSPVGTRRLYTFSADGVLRQATNWTGDVVRFSFDAFGRLAQRTDALNQTTRFQNDLLGNLVSLERPDGSQVKLTYDAGGNAASVTDGNGNVTRYRYGCCGRLLERISPDGENVQYRWGTEPSRLEQVVNEKGETYSFEYDAAGRVVREVGFDGRVQEITYNNAGQRTTITNGNGETVTLVRNAAGRLVEMRLPDGTTNTFRHDLAGNLVAASNPDMALVFERDALGRVIRETQGSVDVRSQYDAVGNVIRLTTGLGHEARYRVDANGALVQLDLLEQSVRFNRNGLGQEVSRFLPGGLEFHQQYDSGGRLAHQRVLSGKVAVASRHTGSLTNQLLERTYQYDDGGLLTCLQDSRWGTFTYQFDAMERPLDVSWSNGVEERFRYDAASNLAAVSLSVDPAPDYVGGSELVNTAVPREETLRYGLGNRLLQQGDTTYSYDGQGRLIRKLEKTATGEPREWQYGWNALDQLRAVRCPDGATWTYRYDPLGRRVAKEGPGQAIRYVWDGEVVVHEQAQEGPPTTWIFDPQNYIPLCKIENKEFYSVLADQLGTPQALFNVRGQIVWSGQYQTWGARTDSSQGYVTCGPSFQGQWFDSETGLHYSLYRYYDPQGGRFLSPDPIGFGGGTNLYSYVPNPTRWIDPLGLAGDIPLGGGWTGRVDRFNTSYGTDHEMHVFAPNGSEAGLHGSQGWFPKHGHKGAPPDIPPHVANTITNIAQNEARRDGLLPEKGRADLRSNDWRDLVKSAKAEKEEEAKKAKGCK